VTGHVGIAPRWDAIQYLRERDRTDLNDMPNSILIRKLAALPTPEGMTTKEVAQFNRELEIAIACGRPRR
jgi:hypothetical protein